MTRWVKILMVALLIGGGVFAAYYGLKIGQKSEVDRFRKVKVAKENLQKTILTTGQVQPYNRLEIKPPIAGRTEEVLVEEGTTIRKGQVLAWMSSTERAVLLDAARAKGAKELAKWEELYKPTPLIAPLDGVIIAKNVQSGQTVTQQDAVLVMSDRLIIKAQVDETDIGEVRLGQAAQIVLDAYPLEPINGKVDHIAYEAKTVNNVTVYEVFVIPEKVPPFMRSGMTTNVTVFVEEKKGVLALPAEAIRQERGRTFVLVESRDEKKIPTPRPVEIGLSSGKRIEITSGLSEGEEVLIRMEGDSQRSRGGNNPFAPFGGGRGGGGRR